MKERLVLYFTLTGFILFFLFHGWNENAGLIPVSALLWLGGKYLLLCTLIFLLSLLLFRDGPRSFLFTCFFLVVYFFFGAVKDGIEAMTGKHWITAYRFTIPFIIILLLTIFLLLKRRSFSPLQLTRFLRILISVLLFYETAGVLYRASPLYTAQTDFGDRYNALLQQLPAADTVKHKPDIYWIVFDEYPAATALQKSFGYKDPLDSILKAAGFFVAANARSNYNYTHYSLSSTLDMQYIPELNEGSTVTMRDLVRGNQSLYVNNVTRYLENAGYDIQNFAIYDLEHHPTQGLLSFSHLPAALVDHQTLFTRTWADIGWQFPNHLKRDRAAADAADLRTSTLKTDSLYKAMSAKLQDSISSRKTDSKPAFFLIHFFLPHEPYIYDAAGRLHFKNTNGSERSNFIPQVAYTAFVARRLIQYIQLQQQQNREQVILVQGDHGYKYEENEPDFNTESCRILYGVYNSRRVYTGWYDSVSSVNGFRILFNQYFHTGIPLLPDHSYNLRYR